LTWRLLAETIHGTFLDEGDPMTCTFGAAALACFLAGAADEVNALQSPEFGKVGPRLGPISEQAGDTSVTGWQVMALQTAKMVGLDVPQDSFKKAVRFLDSVGAADEGYGYTGVGSMPGTTAIGLLCRQYLQGWQPKEERLVKGLNHLKRVPPARTKNIYYYYYATQVMHHFGGTAWKEWNEVMRDHLVKAQDSSKGPHFGSWSAAGDPYGMPGGQLMATSLSLCILEIYYRHVPLHLRQRQEKP
jgi:hypothetical protein